MSLSQSNAMNMLSPLPVDPTDMALARREHQHTSRLSWAALAFTVISLWLNPLLLFSTPAGVLGLLALRRLFSVPILLQPLVPIRARQLLILAASAALFNSLLLLFGAMMDLPNGN